MKFTEELVEAYAKKIYQFAYNRTRHVYDAEDLAQDIVLALCRINFPEKQIENMDAYIHQVCRYVWAKSLRAKRRDQGNVGDEVLEWLDDGSDIEGDFITAEQCARLRQEIMRLSRIRREAIIGFYYDGLSGDELALRLGIPAATVRWHLHRAKSDLKERMEMQETDIYRPRRLHIAHYGWAESPVYTALERDILMQNICYACYDNPMTVEELSRTLGVAAVYLEDKLEALCSMEYMTVSPRGKYATNFFIQTAAYQLAHAKYQFTETMPIAEAYLDVVDAAMDDILDVGFCGEVNDEMLRWDMLFYFMSREIGAVDARMNRTLQLEHGAPLRPDGTRHWVKAFVPQDEVLEAAARAGESDAFVNYLRDASMFSLQSYHLTPVNVNARKLRIPMWGGSWRDFGQREITALRRVRALIRSGETPNDFDCTAIAELIEKGLVTREGGRPALRIPYFSHDQITAVNAALDRHAANLDRDAIGRIFHGYVEHMRIRIPACICENERNHYLTSYDPYNAIPYLLLRAGRLRAPREDERSCICTVMWDD